MTDKKQAGNTPAEAAALPAAVQNLRNTIIDMEAMATSALDEIAALANMMLDRLETPAGYRHPEVIALALEAIWSRAQMASSAVNYEAEQAGANDTNTRFHRRLDARCKYREEEDAQAKKAVQA